MPLYYTPSAKGFEVRQQAIPSPGNNSFLGDIFTSDAPKEQQISCGFYQQNVGEPLVYTYDYDEMKVIIKVEAEHFYISDETGQKVDAKPGDVFYFKKGCTITFQVIGDKDAFAKNFFTGLRPADSA